MIKLLLSIAVFFAASCTSTNTGPSNDLPTNKTNDSSIVADSAKYLGYGARYCVPVGEKCGLKDTTSKYIAWLIDRDYPGDHIGKPATNAFWVYISTDVLISGGIGVKTRYALETAKSVLIEHKKQCLTIYQSGIDTIKVQGKTIIGPTIIEPCVPYFLDPI
jgi:hypothetical protein